MESFFNPLFVQEEGDCECDIHTLLENEVLMLREKVSMLEIDNKVLQRSLQETQTLKVQLESNLLVGNAQQNDGSHHTKKKRELSLETRAFMSFVNEQRNNATLIDTVRDKMRTLGYDVHHRRKVPYQMLKLECDMLYGQLSSNERQRYIDLARQQVSTPSV